MKSAFAMKSPVFYTAFGLALAAGPSLAQAQTIVPVGAADAPLVIAQQPLVEPPPGVALAQPAPIDAVETVRTVTSATVPRARVVRHGVPRRHAANRVMTTRTIVREEVVPSAALAAVPPAVVVAPTLAAAAVQPVPDWNDPEPIYDVVPGAAAVGPPGVVDDPAMVPLTTYHYVYEPDRILVIDDSTGITMQAIPR